MSTPVAVTLFVVGLVVAIMIHEWGHFVTARRFGMRADRFFLGFGPTIWSTRRGETEYGVKALPLGGFVRIRGMSVEERRLRSVSEDVLDVAAVAELRDRIADERDIDSDDVPAVPDEVWAQLLHELVARGSDRALADAIVAAVRGSVPTDATPTEVATVLDGVIDREVPDTGRPGDLRHRLLRGDDGRFFHDRPAWQRFIVLVAGAGTHFVVAAALLLAGFLTFPQATGEILPVVGEFVEDNVAEAAGFEVGDRIIAVDGVAITEFDEVVDVVSRSAGTEIVVVVERDGDQFRLPVTPAARVDEATGEEVGRLGFFPALETERLSVGEAISATFVGDRSITEMVTQTFVAMGRVFGPEGLGRLASEVSGEEERSGSGAISLVGAGALAGQGVDRFGGFFLFGLLASVNVFVGVFNLLPLPPLDGGHVAVLGVEKAVNTVRRRRGQVADFTIDPRTIAAIAVPVIAFVGTISVALLWLDVTNPISLN
ncbi:MAG: site-2 protease family protein [Nitriliruptorales bacterium]|nr:site-2 protease family protein [Nitriliruptorales bacterium]